MIIETDRLVLRPFKESDAADLFEYLKAPEVHCFEDMKITSMEQAVEETKKSALDGNSIYENTYQYAILKKEWK